MAHCGYEPSAVAATMASPRESVRATVDVLLGSIKTPVAKQGASNGHAATGSR